MKFKRIISSILVLSNVFMGVNFVSADNKWNETNASNESNYGINLESINSVDEGISELSPSEYLNYIHRIRNCETKEATHEPTVRIYAVAKTPSGGAYSLRNNEIGDSVTSGGAIEIGDSVTSGSAIEIDKNF